MPLIDERSGMGRDIGKNKDRCVGLQCEPAWNSGKNWISVQDIQGAFLLSLG